jgi:hypothetical protein
MYSAAVAAGAAICLSLGCAKPYAPQDLRPRLWHCFRLNVYLDGTTPWTAAIRIDSIRAPRHMYMEPLISPQPTPMGFYAMWAPREDGTIEFFFMNNGGALKVVLRNMIRDTIRGRARILPDGRETYLALATRLQPCPKTLP